MTDWGTVAIAAISAFAGMGGSVILGFYNIKALAKSHVRDDMVQFRDMVEVLFSELDAIQMATLMQIPVAISMAEGKAPDKPIVGPNLGKLRAIVALYFPDMQRAIDMRQERETKENIMLRTGIEAGESPLTTGGKSALARSLNLSALCDQLRAMLPAKANEIGASVRTSI